MKTDYLILGAGYAGLPTAYRLQRQGLSYLLVNRRPYQTLTALLPELVTGSIKDEDGVIWLRDLLEQVIVGDVREIDLRRRRVVVESPGEGATQVEFRSLVICLGWEPRINLPVRGAVVVEDLPTALRVRHGLLDGRKKVVICGGGFVGVEMAGQITMLRRHMGHEVILMEGEKSLLSGLPEKMQSHARRLLEERGVVVRCNTLLEKVEPGRVFLRDGGIEEADLILWAMGVKASGLVAQAGLSVDDLGRGLVDSHLCSVDMEDVFLAGDCAGTGLPMLGQIAVQQGKFLGEHLPSLVKGRREGSPAFKYKGLAVSLGDDQALAAIGEKVCFSGMLAVALKKIIGKKYFLDIAL